MQGKSEQVSKEFITGAINGVLVCELRKIRDERGWLAELFRQDQLAAEFYPVMAYISLTQPEVRRGPHEHADQADLFCFIGPSNFKLRMWDNRKDSETFNYVMTVLGGEENPKSVLVPPGVVHAYQNVGNVPGIVINCPNRLYMGADKREPLDEIRHEHDPQTTFRIDDWSTNIQTK